MKYSLASLLVLVFTLFSCVFASPVLNSKAIKESLVNHHPLVERGLGLPVKANDGLVAKIMTSVKADLHANVFAAVSATFSEKVAASLKIQASILGGIVKVGEVHVKAIQSAAAKNIKVGFEAGLDAEVQAKIYAPLEVSLRESCTGQLLDEAALLDILVDLETKAKALINVELPKIGASLSVKVKEQIEVAVQGLEVNIPLILQIAIDVAADVKVSLDAAVKVGLQACAKLDAKATALLVLAAL